MALQTFKDNNRTLQLLQDAWKSQLDPVLANPTTNPVLLKQVSLKGGSNIVNTLLGRKLQGWKIVRQRAAATIYDNQDSNTTPDLTLILIASAPVVVDLELF
jgi:hypothetical protein